MDERSNIVGSRGRGLLVLRLLITALGAVLGVVLITRGAALIGAILLTMALLRVILIIGVHRRRRSARRVLGPWAEGPVRSP